MIMVMLIMSLESVKRIGEVLEEEPTIKNPENPLMDVPNGDVTFSNVNFRYKENAEKDTLSHINIRMIAIWLFCRTVLPSAMMSAFSHTVDRDFQQIAIRQWHWPQRTW